MKLEFSCRTDFRMLIRLSHCTVILIKSTSNSRTCVVFTFKLIFSGELIQNKIVVKNGWTIRGLKYLLIKRLKILKVF